MCSAAFLVILHFWGSLNLLIRVWFSGKYEGDMQSYWDKIGLATFGANVAKGRAHPEWRLIISVISFCAGAALTTHLWWHESLHSVEGMSVSLTLLLALLSVGQMKRWWQNFPLILALVFTSGALIGQLRVVTVEQGFEFIENHAEIEGVVERFETRTNGSARLLIRPTRVGSKSHQIPRKVRVSVRTSVDSEVGVGRRVSFAAKLSKPNGPIAPNGYDFARVAYFSQIDVEAIALSPIKLVAGDERAGFDYWVSSKREVIETQLLKLIPGQAGGVAVALTVGFRNHLSQETTEILRRAGLSHLLAISGLHMGLVTAASFFFFELLFAAIPIAALRVMPKKLAVFPAWIVALSYLFLSGASISTIRAFIMVSVGLLAIVTERKVVSLRSVALAALFVTLWRPESVLSIGFQMSFAATTGLVAFYEKMRKDDTKWQIYRKNWFLKAFAYLFAVGVTSIVAQLSVAPFSLFHFQSISVAGVIANIVALPIVSFCVMPLLLFSIISEAIGGLQLLSGLIEAGLVSVLYVAGKTSALPYALLYVAPVSKFVFGLVVSSLLLVLVYRSALSVLMVSIAMLVFAVDQIQVDEGVLISKSGHTLMVHRSGVLYARGGREHSFRSKIWKQYWGKSPNVVTKPIEYFCDDGGCGYDLFNNGVFKLQRVKAMSGIRRACSSQAIVIIPDKYARYCKGARVIIRENTLEQQGPLALIVDEKEIAFKWSNP